MFRPIRRKKNELSAEETQALLCISRIGILAVNGDDGYPYAVPVNYLYDEARGMIYFHGARVGHKAESLEACDKVCFTVVGPETEKDTVWAPYAKSVVAFGHCRALEEGAETLQILKRFAMKYYPDEQTADEEIVHSAKAVRVLAIEIEHLSGKEVQER